MFRAPFGVRKGMFDTEIHKAHVIGWVRSANVSESINQEYHFSQQCYIYIILLLRKLTDGRWFGTIGAPVAVVPIFSRMDSRPIATSVRNNSVRMSSIIAFFGPSYEPCDFFHFYRNETPLHGVIL
jgi:hypothetical protein